MRFLGFEAAARHLSQRKRTSAAPQPAEADLRGTSASGWDPTLSLRGAGEGYFPVMSLGITQASKSSPLTPLAKADSLSDVPSLCACLAILAALS